MRDHTWDLLVNRAAERQQRRELEASQAASWEERNAERKEAGAKITRTIERVLLGNEAARQDAPSAPVVAPAAGATFSERIKQTAERTFGERFQPDEPATYAELIAARQPGA